MSNKEILSELKICYELLNDIYDNGKQKFDEKEVLEIRNIREQIDELYFRLWNTNFANGNEKDLIIKEDDKEVIMIGQSASTDYSIQDKESGEFDRNYITCGDLDYYWYWEELEKSSRGDKNENITDKVVEIEDYNGNTIMAFETNKYGKIINYNNCDIADIDSDYIFDTDKDLMRIQVRNEN